jgi:hypothetical protein
MPSLKGEKAQQRPHCVAGVRGFEPPNVSLTKCLAHQHNLAALPKLFERRSEIVFFEFESSQPRQAVGLTGGLFFFGTSRAGLTHATSAAKFGVMQITALIQRCGSRPDSSTSNTTAVIASPAGRVAQMRV